MNKQLEQLSEGFTLTSRSGDNSIKLDGGKLMITSLDSWADQTIELGSYTQEPQADWSKVAVDTPVTINTGGRLERLYFKEYKNKRVITFMNGQTSFSFEEINGTQAWDSYWVKIDYEQLKKQSIPKWIKNTGVSPDCKFVTVMLCDRLVQTRKTLFQDWLSLGGDRSIDKYIPIPY